MPHRVTVIKCGGGDAIGIAGICADVAKLRAAGLRDAGFTPVLSPPAGDLDGAPLNVDADRLAAAVATALGACRLVMLTAAPGVLRDADDESSLLACCELPDEALLARAASGGMHRKLIAAGEALQGGVPEVRIADGRGPAPLSAALAGAGTVLIHSGKAGS